MPSMKIENYEGAADTFTFPNNPQTFDDSANMNQNVTQLPFQSRHIVVRGATGISPRTLVLSGHFNEVDSVDKRADYRELSKHVHEPKIKKLYFESDKFRLVVGAQIQETNTGDRTAFVDYVANFNSFMPRLLDDTENTDTTSTSTHSSLANSGDAPAYILEYEVTGLNASSGDYIEFQDATGRTIRWISDATHSGVTLTIKFVAFVDSGAETYITKYGYPEIGGSESGRVRVANTDLPQISADSTEDVSITTSGLTYTDTTLKWRDTYYS